MINAKKRTCFVAAALCLAAACAAGTVSVSVRAEGEKEIESVSYNAYEAIVAGEVADLQAQVTFTDGSTEMRPIHYTTFPVDEMTTLFHSFYAEGYVDGWDGVIEQNIIVVPDGVQYMINLGSNYTETDYEVSGEGVLGKELDPTGATSENEGYYAAVRRAFPGIKNKVGAKQYGQGEPAEDGDWGYVGDQQIVYFTGAAEDANPYDLVMFPKRGTTDVTVNFALPETAADYDVYIGFYSHWFARSIGIEMNGDTLETEYSVRPSYDTYKIENVSLQGDQTITFVGNGLYEEALASFICVTEADTQEYPELSAPTAPEILQLTDTELEVTDLTPGSKLQLYNYDTSALLYEYMVGEDETAHTIDLSDIDLDGIVRFGVCCTNAGGMGESAIVQRTDISRFDVSYTQDYVGDSLRLDLSATAYSNIVSLDVYNGTGEIVESRTTTPAMEWSDTLYLYENGDYRLELTSEQGGMSIQEISITNIDNADPVLSVVFDMAAAQASSATSVALSVSVETISPLVESGYVADGTDTAADFSGGTVAFSRTGSYTLYFVNELGKTDAVNVRVAMDMDQSVTADITQSPLQRFTQVNFTGKNGYTVESVTVYGLIDGEAERMLVNGSEDDYRFNIYDDGVYFAEIVTADGSREIVVLSGGDTQPEGPNVGLIVGLSVGGGVVVIGGGLAAFFLVRRRRAAANTEHSAQAENHDKEKEE